MAKETKDKTQEKIAEAQREAEQERLEKMTFEERMDEVRKEEYLVGREDATGQKDAISARQVSPTEARLVVIKDEWKYTVNLDETDRPTWDLRAIRIGELLGIKFDVKDLQPGNPEEQKVKDAQSLARQAGGKFVPDKK